MKKSRIFPLLLALCAAALLLTACGSDPQSPATAPSAAPEAVPETEPIPETTAPAAIAGRVYTPDTRRLTLTDVDIAELEAAIPALPQLEHVTLNGNLPDAQALLALTAAHPDITFFWHTEVFGVYADVNTTELNLSGIPMESVAEAEAAAAYLPSLQKVIMCDCGISNEDMAALNRRHEDILFVWTVEIGRFITLRTDVTAFAPVKFGYEVWDDDLENLRYCTELVVLDLGHMDIWESGFLEPLTKLQYLILADTHITDLSPLENMKELKFLEIFLTPIRDYAPLLGCTALEDLNMCYTTGAPDPIMQMTWLKRLWWCGSYMTWEQQEELRSTLANTEIVMPGLGSTDNGWRKGQNYYDMRDLLGMPYSD